MQGFYSLLAALLLPSLSAMAQESVELEAVPAQLYAMPEERSFDGRVEAVNRSTVVAETRGRVEEIHVIVGDFVPAGTVILSMTSTEQRATLSQAEAGLAEARANLQAEQSEFRRIQELFEQDFVSQAELDRARAALESARARVNNAQAALENAREQVSYTQVRAPYGGVVSERLVETGEAVQPGTPLMSGYDPSRLRVEVDMPQEVAERVREIREARVVPAENGAALDSAIVPEELILYPVADPATSTIRARLELPEGVEGFYPGEFVKVRVKVGETQRLLVPLSSVVYRSEVTGVYVLENGRPALRQIRPGARFGDRLQVLAGLSPGEEVASDPVAAAMALTRRRAASGNAGDKPGANQESGVRLER